MKYCCEDLKKNYDEYDGPITKQKTSYVSKRELNKISFKYMASCYPECGPSFDYIPINYCPFCGEKLNNA